tara:strand:- start:409 stop:546 length:138 start_codon:yes stop_codon:yes gene_type:complete
MLLTIMREELALNQMPTKWPPFKVTNLFLIMKKIIIKKPVIIKQC